MNSPVSFSVIPTQFCIIFTTSFRIFYASFVCVPVDLYHIFPHNFNMPQKSAGLLMPE